MQALRITEIFFSLQGETTLVGLPTIFIRLTGCPLRCSYCDTTYAFKGGKNYTIPAIMDLIKSYNTPYVTVTGGEPLAQPACINLLTTLCDAQYCVSLETSGALDITMVDKRVIKILDLKTPASGESSQNNLANLNYLTNNDQIKLVICNRSDYEWAKQLLLEQQLFNRCPVLFSPSYQDLKANELAEWILSDQLPVRLQIQLHKYLWGDLPGR